MKSNLLLNAVLSGISFGASMFGAGFILGTVRVLVLVPSIGEFHAVLIELPLMMIFCWHLSANFVKKIVSRPTLLSRSLIGLFGFSTLMLLEVALCLLVFGKTMDETMVDFASPKGRIGIAGQVLSSLFPVWQLCLTPKEQRD